MALAFDEAVELVRQGGGRITKARRILLEDLFNHGGRTTAEQLAERHHDIDTATVYRSLAHFEEVGVVEEEGGALRGPALVVVDAGAAEGDDEAAGVAVLLEAEVLDLGL